MTSQSLQKFILWILVIGIVLYGLSFLKPQIEKFTEKTARSIESVNVEQVAVRRVK